MEAVVIVEEDGLDKLCIALYGKLKIAKMLGGNEAAVLYDAADKIEQLLTEIDQLQQDLMGVTKPTPPRERAVDVDYLNSDEQRNKALGKVSCT